MERYLIARPQLVQCSNCLMIEGLPEEVDGRHLALEDGVRGGGWRGAQETFVVHL